jgi:hypothetical protein
MNNSIHAYLVRLMWIQLVSIELVNMGRILCIMLRPFSNPTNMFKTIKLDNFFYRNFKFNNVFIIIITKL